MSRDVVDTFTTPASLVYDVTDTNWTQNGSAHGRHLEILINVDFNHTTTTTTTAIVEKLLCVYFIKILFLSLGP